MLFRDLLDEYRIPYSTTGRHTRPGWLQLRCPFCHGGRDPDKPYLGYNTVGNYANCWRCGKHSPAAVLAALAALGPAAAAKAVQGLSRAKLAPDTALGVYRPPPGVIPLTDPHAKAHRNYLDDRGFRWPEIDQLWRVGCIRMSHRLPWRLFIPIDYQGRAVSWTTRTLGNREPRYIGAKPDEEAMPHKRLLYGEDYVRHAVIVVEGPTDVWALGPGAVGLLGVGYTPAQVRRLARYPVRAVCFDAEPAAQRRARALVDALLPFEGETYNVVLDTGKDPAAASVKERRQLRRTLLRT